MSQFSSFKLHNLGHIITVGGQLKFFYPVPFYWIQCDTYVIGRGIVPSQVEKPNFGDYHCCSCHLGVHCSQSIPHCHGWGWRSYDLWIFCRYLSFIYLFLLLFCSRDQGQKHSRTQQPVPQIESVQNGSELILTDKVPNLSKPRYQKKESTINIFC